MTKAIERCTPSVTVIIPTIGRPKYIADTVRSVLAQDFEQLTVLISDNAPETPTAIVLQAEGIFDPRIAIVSRAKRMPFSEHMNACIADAPGEFMMILSDDDQLSGGYVSEMHRLLSADSTLKVALGRQVKVGAEPTGVLPVPPPTCPVQIVDGTAFLQGIFSGRLVTGVLTNISMFARRADVLALGGFQSYPDGSHADNNLLVRLALLGKVALGSEQMLYRVYLTSFGLSTPFSALLEATRAYTCDAAAAVRSAKTLARRDMSTLVRLLKYSNTRLLLNRLRHVYRRRLSAWALVSSVLQTVRFAATPVRWL